MIPIIAHPAAELLVRQLNEAAALLASKASQLDGLARSLLNERDSVTGLSGFETAFPGGAASDAIDCIVAFREFYRFLSGHDVPPIDGLPALELPERAPVADQASVILPNQDSQPVVEGAAAAVSSAPVDAYSTAAPPAANESAPTETKAPAEPVQGGEAAAQAKGKRK